MIKGAKVLIVEDEVIVALGIKTFLLNMGYDIVNIISSAERAYQYLQREPVDIVIIDIYLAGLMDGIELAKLINDLFYMPVIFLSANSDKKIFDRAKGVESYAYISKPFKEKELSLAIEISLQKFNEQRSRNNKFHNIEYCLNKSNDLVCIMNNRFNSVFINETFSKITGKTLETLERSGGFFNLICDSSLSDKIIQCLKANSKFNSDIILQTSFGNNRIFRLTAESIYTHSGEFMGYMLIGADKQKNIELESEKFNISEKYISLLDSINQPVIIFSIDDLSNEIIVSDINDKLSDYLKLSRAELLSNSIDYFIISEESNIVHDKLISLEPGDQLTTSIRFKDVDHYIKKANVNLICSYSGNIKIVVATFVEQSFKKDYIDEYMLQNIETHGLIHDVNNMLSVIAGYTHILDYELQDLSVDKDYLKDIKSSNEKAISMCRQILNNGRASVETKVIDINRFIEQKCDLIRKLLADEILLEINTSTDQIPILINKRQLEQVFINLIKNAEEAISFGGLIRISVEKKVINSHEIVEIVVNDNGKGVDIDDIEKVFEPYYSSKVNNNGTGLGLSMVKSIVEHHGGLIYCLSDVEHGTSFIIQFPKANSSFSYEITDYLSD